VITIESLTRAYGSFTAVDDVSFSAQPGRVTGFLGPNGAGKSTTMRIIVGLTQATSGVVRVLERVFELGGGRDLGVSMPGVPGLRRSSW